MSEEKKKRYESQNRATAKYNKANYDRLYPFVKKGKKAVYLEAVEKGEFASLNEFIETAADNLASEVLERDREENPPAPSPQNKP